MSIPSYSIQHSEILNYASVTTNSSTRVKNKYKRVLKKNQEGLFMNSRPRSHQAPLQKSVGDYGKNSAVKGSEFVL